MSSSVRLTFSTCQLGELTWTSMFKIFIGSLLHSSDWFIVHVVEINRSSTQLIPQDLNPTLNWFVSGVAISCPKYALLLGLWHRFPPRRQGQMWDLSLKKATFFPMHLQMLYTFIYLWPYIYSRAIYLVTTLWQILYQVLNISEEKKHGSCLYEICKGVNSKIESHKSPYN